MKKFATFGIVVSVLALFFLPDAVASAQTMPGGLVPCGNGNDPCTLCHFIVGFHNLVSVMLKLVATAALAGIFIAGVMYIISAGDETMMTGAKNFIKASVTGFVVVLGAFLIVNVTMWALSAKDSNGDGMSDMGVGQAGWFSFTCSTESLK